MEGNKVHHVLAHSYLVYLVLLLAGVCLDLIFDYEPLSNKIMVPVGLVALVLGTIIILWAQKTGRELRKVSGVKAEHFKRGPYHYSRVPTQWGLFLMVFGFGVATNSFFVILFTILALIIFKFAFLEKHDRFLIEKYGEAYTEYRKLMHF